jgi:hypothetical protein
METKTQQTVDPESGPDQRVEMHIGDVTSAKIKRLRVGWGKPLRFFAQCMEPLEVHRKRGLSDQNHFFQPPMTEFPGKMQTVDLEMT